MKKVKRIEILGREIECHELTVAQIKELMDKKDATEEENVINMLFPERVPVAAVCLSTGLKIDEMFGEEVAPSDLEQIWSAVEEANPSYARAAKRVAKIMEQIVSRKLIAQ